MSESQESVLRIFYRNYKGERGWRHLVQMTAPYWGSNEWYPSEQWLMDAFDLDKNAIRTFALNRIQLWGNPVTDIKEISDRFAVLGSSLVLFEEDLARILPRLQQAFPHLFKNQGADQ